MTSGKKHDLTNMPCLQVSSVRGESTDRLPGSEGISHRASSLSAPCIVWSVRVDFGMDPVSVRVTGHPTYRSIKEESSAQAFSARIYLPVH